MVVAIDIIDILIFIDDDPLIFLYLLTLTLFNVRGIIIDIDDNPQYVCIKWNGD